MTNLANIFKGSIQPIYKYVSLMVCSHADSFGSICPNSEIFEILPQYNEGGWIFYAAQIIEKWLLLTVIF